MSSPPNPIHDRIRGCIVGGALGDAIGLFTEFFDANKAQQIYGSNPRFKLRPPAPEGHTTMHMDEHRAGFEEAGWTDDTDQSLLILMSFLNTEGKAEKGIDHVDFAKRLDHWMKFGFRPLDRLANDVGNTVRSVVSDPAFLEEPIECSKRIWEKGGCVMAANGAVMRTPVVGALFFKDEEKLYQSAMNCAAVTHADPRCLVSCTVASGLVAALIRDEVHSESDIVNAVENAILPVNRRQPHLDDHAVQELRSILWRDSLKELELDQSGRAHSPKVRGETLTNEYSGLLDIRSSALRPGVWALREGIKEIEQASSSGTPPDCSSTFERIITEITMAGGDSDTNGAVAGSLLGALFGYSKLPASWVQDLEHRDWLLSKSDAAAYLVTSEGTPYQCGKDKDNLVDGGKGEMTQAALDKEWKAYNETVKKRVTAYESRAEQTEQPAAAAAAGKKKGWLRRVLGRSLG